MVLLFNRADMHMGFCSPHGMAAVMPMSLMTAVATDSSTHDEDVSDGASLTARFVVMPVSLMIAVVTEAW